MQAWLEKSKTTSKNKFFIVLMDLMLELQTIPFLRQMKPPLTQFLCLSLAVGSCQNPNSNTVGRYVQFRSDAIHDGHPCLLDTDEGIVYVVPVGPFYHAFTDALTGKELPDSSMAHWVPIVQFGE